MAKILRCVLYLLVVAPACLCIYLIYTQASDAELRGRVDELEAQNDRLQRKRDELEGRVRSVSELKGWEDRLTSKQLSLSNQVEIAELREKTSNERAQKAEERANDAERRVKSADERISAKELEIDQLEKKRDNLEREIGSKQSQLNSIVTDVASNIVVKSTLIKEVEGLGKQVERDRAEYESVHSVVTNLQSQKIELLSAIRNKTMEYETLVAVIKGRIIETNRLSAAVTVQEGTLEKLQTQAEGLTKDVEEQKTTRTGLNEEVLQLKSDKRIAEQEYNRLEGLRAESARAVREAAVEETNTLARLRMVQVRTAKAEAEAKQVAAELENVKGQLEQSLPVSADVGKLLSQKQKLEGEIKTIENDLKDKKNNLLELEKMRTAVQEDVDRLNVEAKKVRDKLITEITNFTVTVSKTLEQDKKED